MVATTWQRVAARQDGLVSRRQARALGISDAAIEHRTGAEGRWQRVLPGVYATFTGPLEVQHRLRAAVLYAGEPSWVTGAELCRRSGLRYVPADDGVLDVLVPIQRRVRHQPTVRVHRSAATPVSPWWVDGLPGDALPSAVLIAARRSTSLREVRALLCEPVQRRLVFADQLVEALARGPSSGSALPRRAMRDITAGCRSAPECELRDLVLRSRVLPEPLWNVALPGVVGTQLVPDACWPEARLVVEIDSVEWHRFGDAPERTERRRARLAALGWRVVPVSPRRLREEPLAVLRELEAAFISCRSL